MDSAKNLRMVIPSKKLGMKRVNNFQLYIPRIYHVYMYVINFNNINNLFVIA